jgi:Fuc2NAc and GlcNAc transferase
MLLAFCLGLLLATRWMGPWPVVYQQLAGIALVLMLLGIADDVWSLSVRLRFAIYGLSCLAAVLLLFPFYATDNALLTALLIAAATLAMLWFVNLFNFMDGIDGIAAIQCLLACAAAAFLASRGGGQDYAVFCLLLAASQLGFLLWNWPPARLFMGDAGSIPSGFLLAGLALSGGAQGGPGLACWVILLAVFITDTSWTLLWRMASRQAFTQPHRLHAYQRLSTRWGSHLKVDLLFVAIFCVWLFPLAWMAQVHPGYTFLLVILAYFPLLLGMAKTRPLA